MREPLVENNGRGLIEFHYPKDWHACRFDEENDDTNAFHRTRLKGGGLSAVDFIARAADGSELVLVECKDFRTATPENLPRFSRELTADEQEASRLLKNAKLKVKAVRAKPFLAEEFAKNVRDTVLGLTAACRAGDKTLMPYGQLLANSAAKLVCVLALELDPPDSWEIDGGRRLLGLLKTSIEQQLRFLDEVEVVIHWSVTPPPRKSAWRIEAK